MHRLTTQTTTGSGHLRQPASSKYPIVDICTAACVSLLFLTSLSCEKLNNHHSRRCLVLKTEFPFWIPKARARCSVSRKRRHSSGSLVLTTARKDKKIAI